MRSRRDFLIAGSGAALASASAALAAAKPYASDTAGNGVFTQRIPIDRDWMFRTESGASGQSAAWNQPDVSTSGWTEVQVPHTWQVMPGLEEYRGVAWYHCGFDTCPDWAGKRVQIEFEAVFHTATVWVNGEKAGEHLRKGYTAFVFDITRLLRPEGRNVIAVKVDNTFDENMLPRGRSSDWAHDGGIFRPVWLLVTPSAYVERVTVEAIPDLVRSAAIDIVVTVRNGGDRAIKGEVGFRVLEDNSGNVVLQDRSVSPVSLTANETREIAIPAQTLADPKLWHFDHPNLYSVEVTLTAAGQPTHTYVDTFGIRKIEIRDGKFFVNGEHVRLMGVERMAGSNPEFGMAEPAHWIVHDHDDMKNLNCIFTRVHWPQDRRVLDFCDRHGMFIQTEVPTWGPNTFANMGDQPLPALMQNGIEQLTEMVHRDRNHPCIFSWGLCNEIGGQNPPAFHFAQNMLAAAKKLDPHRLCSYASHSLHHTQSKDVAAIMDFVEVNEYWESWSPGTVVDVGRELKEIQLQIPNKPIVISEYGYCACAPGRPEGDGHRIRILKTHTEAARELDFMAGLIFFDYNDYRTHVGDKGAGSCRQRIHGVVDLYGHRKPSYEVLRTESSPVESITVRGNADNFTVTVTARKTIPAYTLVGYKLRAIFYNEAAIPVERVEAELPPVRPGETQTVKMAFSLKEPRHVQFDVLRPTGFSTFTQNWLQ
jgi:beta-glucuronidase